MSTMPWGTMNGWLRLEAEQRGAWTRQRVQDLRAAQVARKAALATQGLTAQAPLPQSPASQSPASQSPASQSPAQPKLTQPATADLCCAEAA